MTNSPLEGVRTTKFKPHEYQQYAIDFLLTHEEAGLLLDMGLGKTVITLTAIQELIDRFEAQRVLIVAPLRVAQAVWEPEARKWDHTKGLRIQSLTGPKERRKEGIQAEADIYVINRENLAWLVAGTGSQWPFDMVVLDELSSFKSRASQRWKALRRVRGKIHRIVGLTGTPTPNGLLDLWPQMALLDRGKALGKTLGGYRDEYFKPGRRNGHIVFDWQLKPDAQEKIYKRLEGLCVSMQAAEYLQMPERIDNAISVLLDEQTRAKCDQLERDCVLAVADEQIMAASAAAVSNKLLQMAQGAIYDEDGHWHRIHDAKLDALQDVIEAANGQPVLVYYTFRFDLERIKERFPEAVELKGAQEVRRWNAGEIPILIAHPASAGHGLNLQAGGSQLVWYGLNWSLELYQQANARLYRQGQTRSVVIHHLVARGTIDEDVMAALARKADGQQALMDALKVRVEKWTT